VSDLGGALRRFAFFSSCGEPWGGSEELWFESACALRSLGHEVFVLKTGVDLTEPRIQELRAQGCRVHDLNKVGPDLLWYAASSPVVARVAVPLQMAVAGPRLVFPRRVDLAVVSQGGNFDGVNFAGLCQRLGIPYILVSQKASSLYWPADRVRAYVRHIHESALRTVFVSQHNLWLTRQQLDADLPRAVVVDNPVLAGWTGPLPWPEQHSPVRLASIGRLWVRDKGQDLLFETLAREKWRERALEVSVYGRGLNREGLEGMVRRLALGNVTFHGQVAEREEVWRNHHGLILTSRAEGSPLVVREAMACGRVPVVTDAGGTIELVEDGVTGFVADASSVNAIDGALERAWARLSEWPVIGARAGERMTELLRARDAAPLAALALRELEGRVT
jgi:glycosyltransferase involved in cell wall biosynthesis